MDKKKPLKKKTDSKKKMDVVTGDVPEEQRVMATPKAKKK